MVVGGDGMVHLAVQALADSETRLGLIPAGTGNDVARYFDIPRKDTAAATDVVIGGKERRVDLARIGSKYFVTVLAAGFDAIVNERANEMTWPKGQMRYNLATLAELRTFKPIPYVVEIDGEQHRFEAMMVAVGNGPSFGGGLRITEGAAPRRRAARRGRDPADEQGGAGADLPQAVQGHPRPPPRLPPPPRQEGHDRRARASRRTPTASGSRALPLTVEVAPLALRVLVP